MSGRGSQPPDALMTSIGGADQTIMNQSLFPPASTKTVKVKPRDFKANPKLLKEIGADNYDQFGDLIDIHVDMENKIEKLRHQWKCYDQQKLEQLIRK